MYQLQRFLYIVAFSWPLSCGAAEICPWLNAATAAGIVDSTVDVTVTHPNANADDATCEFTMPSPSAVRELRIEVLTLSTVAARLCVDKFAGNESAQCTSKPVALKAIGNRAAACSVSGKNGQLFEQVVGRVRDHLFVIQMRTSDTRIMPNVLEKASAVAEHVAGILF